jgi:L-threonylcarbamoyladenylate synthase
MKAEIEKAVEVLHAGGTILYLTDTIWGIGCDPTNAQAIDRVRNVKARGDAKSMIILLDDVTRLDQFVRKVPEVAWDFLDQVDTPVTIIYPGAQNLAKNLVAADGSIAIRVVHDPFCQELIRSFGKPIVSTSANLSGDPYPLTFNKINPQIINTVDYVIRINLDLVRLAKPSSIVKLGLNGEIELIRP